MIFGTTVNDDGDPGVLLLFTHVLLWLGGFAYADDVLLMLMTVMMCFS